MIKRICAAAVVLLLCSINLYSLSISINSDQWNNYQNIQLNRMSVPVVDADGELRPAVSLAELFPVMFEAWQIEVVCSGNSPNQAMRDPELADNLQNIFIFADSDGWRLEYAGMSYSGVSSININGDILKKQPLEVWINWEGAGILKKEIGRYADMHETEIKVTEVPRPDSKLISVMRGGGQVPDVIMVQSSYIDSLVRSESLQNVDYFYPEGLISQGREAFTYSGLTWGVPFYFDAQLMFYNPELITGPTFDWSLRDYEQLCRGLEEKKIIPSAWNAYSASFLLPFQISFGKSKLIEPDGSIIIADESTRKALEYIIGLKEAGLMSPMERDAMTALFVSGDAAMIISASYSIPHFEDLGIPFEAVPLPVNQTTGRRVSPLLDFKAFAVTRKSKNPVGARRLIEYLTGTGVQQRFSTAVSKLPARNSARSAVERENRYFEALRISAEAGTIIPTDKAYSVYKNTMWKMLRFAISGRMNAAQVLEKTQELVDKNLDDIN